VSVDKSFYSLNSTRKGNVLTVQRRGDDVDFYFSPSVAVPMILNVTRNSAQDAYAYYNVTVDGQVQETGSSLMQWTGIGEGCVDFAGSGMSNWDNSGDMRADSAGDGYGLSPSWRNAIRSGTVSLWGVLYAPQGTSTIMNITRASESASFDSSQGSGPQLNINTSNAANGVGSLKEVFDLVADEQVCVIGSEYFWNTLAVAGDLQGKITGIESTCIPSQTS
jgi:hypothetical protein